MRTHWLASVSLAAFLAAACNTTSESAPAIAWRPWSATAFTEAKERGSLVVLDLGTTWCHWCHVMEETTWADPAVRQLVAQHYVAIEEDADRRLDLAARYQDYGWPATIVFDAEGRELWKNRGYVEPERMRHVLQLLVNEPVPLAEGDASAVDRGAANGLAAATRTELESRMDVLYDAEAGGFRGVHKYLDGASAEWLLTRARAGDATARMRLLQTLDAERALLDPIWGGAYQYSHGGVWTNPHFEKVMGRQLADQRSYALAYGAFAREEDLAAARSVARFLMGMLRAPEGAFWASQDADLVRGEHGGEYFALDDAGRRARGLPHIETSLWSRENGQAIAGLCALLAVAPDAELQAVTLRAAEWILAHRRLADGSFAHGEADVGGPFLADSLEMAGAMAALAELTADPRWLTHAVEALLAIEARFAPRVAGAGYATAVGDGVLAPVVDRTENVRLARVANRVFQQTGDAALRRLAERAFAHVAQDAIALQRGLPADLLLAADELAREPLHVVVVGDAGDANARELFATALRSAPAYRVVEWIAPGETTACGDSLPLHEVAAAFVCANGACSAPVETAERLGQLVATP